METQKIEETKNYLHRRSKSPYWDWFSESPIEIILVTFILVVFFFMPRQNCGITPPPDESGVEAQGQGNDTAPSERPME